MPKLTIDGGEIEVPAGTTILQACELAGIEIAHFCFHERLQIAGNCRMCLVEVERSPKPIASCAMPVADNMVVHTKSEKAVKAQRGVMEFLLINHPLDCPICDQGGECDLQDQAMAYGFDRGRFEENKRAVRDKNFGPLVETHMTRCIHCTRCIRFLTEIAGVQELGATGRGENMEITTYIERALSSELSANIIDLCPVGALTSKPYAFVARPWELAKTETIDVFDAVGSNIRVDTRDSQVLRVLPRVNEAINEEWISDKTRYAIDGLRRRRLDRPYVGRRGARAETRLARGARHRRRAAEVGSGRADRRDRRRSRRRRGDVCAEGTAGWAWSDQPRLPARRKQARSRLPRRLSVQHDDRRHRSRRCLSADRHEPALGSAARQRAAAQAPSAGRVSHRGDRTGARSDLSGRDAGRGRRDIGRARGRRPPVVRGSALREKPDADPRPGRASAAGRRAYLAAARAIAESCGMVRDGWNGFNVLHRAAARVGGLDLGFVPGPGGSDVARILEGCRSGRIELLYLLGADEIDSGDLGDAFVVYQGHHGDRGAARADVILPGAAYTEKDGTYVNTEGRVQRARRAVFPPGEAREDWRIVRALSGAIGQAAARSIVWANCDGA